MARKKKGQEETEGVDDQLQEEEKNVDDQDQKETDGQIDVLQILAAVQEQGEKVGKFEKLIGNFANEHGELRRDVGSVKELLSKKEEAEVDFDPYNKEQLLTIFQEVVKPLQEQIQKGQESFITHDGLAELVEGAGQVTAMKQEFKMSDKEAQDVINEASEKKMSARELAFEKYGDRKFTKNLSQKMRDELENDDIDPPPDSSSESIYKNTSVPTDPRKFNEMFAKKGSEGMKRLLMEVTNRKE